MAPKTIIHQFVLTILILWCCPVSIARKMKDDDVRLTIGGVTSIATTDENFICATLDWWPVNKCDYGQCPWGLAGIPNLDLKNEILYKAVKSFGPLRIRVGGSLQDQMIYKVGDAALNCTKMTKQSGGLFGFSEGCLEMQRWDQLNNFFSETGVILTFGLNALFGRIKIRNSDRFVGDWNPQNAKDLMNYTISKGYKIDSYEFGNELTGGVSATVTPTQYAQDFKVLKQLVTTLYPDPSTQPKLLGPAGYFDQKWFTTFLQTAGPNAVDGITHHIYNLGPGNDKNLIHKIQDPYFLDQMAQTFKDIKSTVNTFGPWAGAWVGEAGGAYNSGGKTVSNTFADGYWYLDQLGMSSTFNTKVYCRQALIGGNYALLNTSNFIPNPDFYGALLWHKLMGKNVLSATHNGSPNLRVYSHCAKMTKTGITILMINMDNSTTYKVKLYNDLNLYSGPGWMVKKFKGSENREEYHLTPKGGDIHSRELLLNGNLLKLNATYDIPQMQPKLVKSSSPLVVKPQSFLFVTVRDFHAPACAK